MELHNETPDAPVAAMTARVAELWRAQGEDFLNIHHADVVADVDRLRTAVVNAPTLPRIDAERLLERLPHIDAERLLERLPHIATEGLLDRLRKLDADAIERMSAARVDAVIDLTGAEPVVTVLGEQAAVSEPATGPQLAECRRCRNSFPDDMLVHPGGDRVRPLCIDCAFVFAGVRRSH
jgi:hypothetical protein